MAFPISKIELHIDDNIIAQAEKLLEAGQPQQVTETDAGLWIGLVQTTEASFEIEVLLKGKQVRAHTCDCGRSGKKQYCEHVVTMLLYLLKAQKKSAKKPIQKESVNVPKRVTLSYLLDLVDPNDLKHFLKEHAGEDRHFALLLKAHFAYLLPRSNDTEPIEQVLSNTIKTIKRPGKTLSRKDWKMLQKVLTTLLQQAEDSLHKKHYSDVFETAEAILKQLGPLLLMVDDRKILIATIRKVISLLQNLCTQQLAPELEDEIWNLCFREADKKVYYLYEIWDAFLDLLVQLASTKQRHEALLDLIDLKLNDRFVQKNKNIYAHLVNYKIHLFELQHNEAALHRYLEENITHPEVLKQAIQLAHQQENWKQLQQLTHFAIKTQDAKNEELVLLQDLLLKAAVHLKKRKTIRTLSLTLFLQTYQFEYFQLYKKVSGKKWFDKRAILLEEFSQQPFHIDQKKTLARIYSEERMTTELRQHLLNTQSLDLIKHYDQQLFEQNLVATNELYREVISNYLDNYMGRPAAIKIGESIAHLKQTGQAKLAKELVSFILENYKDRKSLVAELG